MFKKLLIISFLLLFKLGQAQVELDNSLILNGTAPADKQIEGLAEPDSLNMIITAQTVQANQIRYGIAAGADSLVVSINSGLQFYSPGNIVYFKATASNAGPVQLSINNQPFFPLRKFYSQDLKAENLKAGQVYCAVFSGTEFQLLSPVNTDCRTGFLEMNKTYCIEQNERTAATLWDAITTCSNINARLCHWGEWYYACQKTGTGIANMIGNWEWTDDAADAKMRVTGQTSCTHRGVYLPPNLNAYRCCYSK